MGTRGFITFVIDGEEKTAYNHYDSYPDYLGVEVLRQIKTEAVTPDKARELRVVSPDSEPTDEDINRLSEFVSTPVYGDLKNWYVLLRGTQGDPAAMLRAGVIEDASEFPLDSLFAEWGYVIDFDTMRFEVYRGFQTQPHDEGRFSDRAPLDRGDSTQYYPVKLVAQYDMLGGLPSEADFLAKLGDE